VFNQNEGTLVVEYIVNAARANLAIGQYAASLTSGNNDNISIKAFTNSGGVLSHESEIVYSGVTQVKSTSVQIGIGNKVRQVIAWKNNNAATSLNGSDAEQDNSCSIPFSAGLTIGNDNSSRALNGAISRITYYPVRLDNAFLPYLSKQS
jgi:hypothetical protein